MRIISTVAVLLLTLLTACGTTPTQRWAAGRGTLTAVQDTVGDLHDAGIVKDEEVVRMDTIVQTARRALAVAETQLPEGGDDFDDWMEVVRAALDRLAQMERARIAAQ